MLFRVRVPGRGFARCVPLGLYYWIRFEGGVGLGLGLLAKHNRCGGIGLARSLLPGWVSISSRTGEQHRPKRSWTRRVGLDQIIVWLGGGWTADPERKNKLHRDLLALSAARLPP